MYRAHVTKASEFDDKDNAPTINRILALRQERALLLGFSSHAEVSLAKKMASLDGANALLEELRAKSYDKAAAEHQELEEFAGRPLANWDVSYYAEKLKVARYAFDEEQTRQYLPLDAVLAGLFGVCRRLFSVDIAQVEHAPTSPLHLPCISPTSTLHLPCTSPASPLHLPCISPASPLHLPYISPTSPLHLPYISPISPLRRRRRRRRRRRPRRRGCSRRDLGEI